MFDKARNLMLINDTELRHQLYYCLPWYEFILVYLYMGYTAIKILGIKGFDFWGKIGLFTIGPFIFLWFLILGLNKRYRKSNLGIHSYKELEDKTNEY